MSLALVVWSPHAPAQASTRALPAAGCSAGALSVAVAGPMTGSEANYGQQQANAVALAFRQINAAGGIAAGRLKGCKVTISGPYDDKADPALGAQIASKVSADDSILGYFGDIDSSVTTAALPILARAGIPMLTAASSNPKLTTLGYTNFFRVTINDNQAAADIGRILAQDFHRKRIAAVWVNDTYGQGLIQAFRGAVARYHATLAVDYGYQPDATDYSVFVTQAKNAHVDGIAMLGTYTENALQVKQLAAAGLKAGSSLTIVGTSSDNTASFPQLAGSSANGVYIAGFWNAGNANAAGRRFAEQYRRAYGSLPPEDAATAYDAAEVWAWAVAHGGTTRSALITVLHNTHDYQGVTGRIDFTKTGERQNTKSSLLIVRGGRIIPVPGQH